MCAHKNRKVRVIMNTQQIIETAEEKLIHTYNRYQIVLDKGDGVRLYDTDGKEYLDFGAGIAVFALGYNNKEYNDALKAQIDKLIHTSNYFYNEPAVEAATALTKASGMDRVFFTKVQSSLQRNIIMSRTERLMQRLLQCSIHSMEEVWEHLL